jgi:hypothetical protein
MAQLVGQHCVHCQERFSSEFGARFCARCGCPVHDDCRRTSGVAENDCPACGAPAAEVARWRPVADASARKEAALHGQQAGMAVWYVTDGWLRRLLKSSWYEDRGWLVASKAGLVFSGRGMVLRMKPTLVEHTDPFLPWPVVGWMFVANCLIMSMVLGGVFKTFTVGDPSTYAMLLFINFLMIATHPLRWVRVRYADESGKDGEAYFAVASPLIRLLGGTARLFEQLTAPKT